MHLFILGEKNPDYFINFMFNHTIDFFRFIMTHHYIGKDVKKKNVEWLEPTPLLNEDIANTKTDDNTNQSDL
ncbi:MAG: hypothetical protein OXC64_07040 [Flavobacteriaceae bacterium]|nr:hypothetical protein [Flavobacteriaceae bacterium]